MGKEREVDRNNNSLVLSLYSDKFPFSLGSPSPSWDSARWQTFSTLHGSLCYLGDRKLMKTVWMSICPPSVMSASDLLTKLEWGYLALALKLPLTLTNFWWSPCKQDDLSWDLSWNFQTYVLPEANKWYFPQYRNVSGQWNAVTCLTWTCLPEMAAPDLAGIPYIYSFLRAKLWFFFFAIV